jgi:hypothetical protein
MKTKLVALGVLICWGCGGSAFEVTDSTGGAAGDSSTGGNDTATGGTRATGGMTSDGGVTSDGGSTNDTGGVSSDGGTASTGGTANTGGMAMHSGGTSRGGGNGKGGAVSAGGTPSGGSPNTGGTSMNTGGTKSSGGTTNTGGFSTITGGTANTGGFSMVTGGTTNTGGTSAGTGGSGGGLGGLSCDQLAERYRVVLAQAQVCQPNATDPCTVSVSSSLFCGCKTFASTQHPEQLNELTAIQKEASKRNCLVACPAIACIDPPSASCTAMASTGTSTAYACKNAPGGIDI